MNHSFDQLFPTINTITNSGTIRNQAEDFKVTEISDIQFTEHGEHLWLLVKKINSNTAWAATKIASACKVPARQVGYAGLKDRHAVTQQWFSVQLPKIKDVISVQANLPDELQIIESHWHQSKLKRGQLKANHFTLHIKNITGDQAQIENNLSAISKHGVPNYFGPQRFGHNMQNLNQAEAWFKGDIKVNNKNLRSLYISAARSQIFNQIIAHRITNDNWDQVIKGDIMQLSGSHSWFPEKDAKAKELLARLSAFDVHITAALWGEDEVQSTGACAELEQSIASQHPIYCEGFKIHRVQQDRRSMRLVPMKLKHRWANEDLLITMELSPGAYATSVLREVLKVTDKSSKADNQ